MRTVEDGSGHLYVVLEVNGERVDVLEPGAGQRERFDRSALTVISEEAPLSLLAVAGRSQATDSTAGVHDIRAVGLLVVLGLRGPAPVQWLLDETGLCESDLHGMVTELRAAGLVEEASVGGRRGYSLTENGSEQIPDALIVPEDSAGEGPDEEASQSA